MITIPSTLIIRSIQLGILNNLSLRTGGAYLYPISRKRVCMCKGLFNWNWEELRPSATKLELLPTLWSCFAIRSRNNLPLSLSFSFSGFYPYWSIVSFITFFWSSLFFSVVLRSACSCVHGGDCLLCYVKEIWEERTEGRGSGEKEITFYPRAREREIPAWFPQQRIEGVRLGAKKDLTSAISETCLNELKRWMKSKIRFGA